MFRSSTRLSTGAPCRTSARAADAPIPLRPCPPLHSVKDSAAASSNTYSVAGIAFRSVIARPPGSSRLFRLALFAALFLRDFRRFPPTGRLPDYKLRTTATRSESWVGRSHSPWDLGWRQRPGRAFPFGSPNGTRCRCRVTRSTRYGGS